jgi:hypothetical protein
MATARTLLIHSFNVHLEKVNGLDSGLGYESVHGDGPYCKSFVDDLERPLVIVGTSFIGLPEMHFAIFVPQSGLNGNHPGIISAILDESAEVGKFWFHRNNLGFGIFVGSSIAYSLRSRTSW